jgi:hypothetical protein
VGGGFTPTDRWGLRDGREEIVDTNVVTGCSYTYTAHSYNLAGDGSAAGTVSMRALSPGHFPVEVRAAQATVDRSGGTTVMRDRLRDQFAKVNAVFNSGQGLRLHYDFEVDSFSTYTDSIENELSKGHPKTPILVLYDEDTNQSGGWLGGLGVIIHKWTAGGGDFSQWATDGLVHELGHSQGAVDEYAVKVSSNTNGVTGTEFAPPSPSIMNYPYDVHTWDPYSVAVMNRQGEGVDDTNGDTAAAQLCPRRVTVAVTGANGIIRGVRVEIYPIEWSWWAPGAVGPTPSWSGWTDDSGSLQLPENPFGAGVDPSRPWNIRIPLYLVRVSLEGRTASAWLDIFAAGVQQSQHPGTPYVLNLGTDW